MNTEFKKFKVAIDDLSDFEAILNDFNLQYKTDFKIDRSEFLDGVEFVFVSCSNVTLDEIFLFGSYFEGSYLRKNKKYTPPQ